MNRIRKGAGMKHAEEDKSKVERVIKKYVSEYKLTPEDISVLNQYFGVKAKRIILLEI